MYTSQCAVINANLGCAGGTCRCASAGHQWTGQACETQCPQGYVATNGLCRLACTQQQVDYEGQCLSECDYCTCYDEFVQISPSRTSRVASMRNARAAVRAIRSSAGASAATAASLAFVGRVRLL